MCGLAGWVSRKPVEEGQLRLALSTMAYRGPDARGTWLHSRRHVGFGHLRLSIRDLSDSGAQPMLDDFGNCIVFNGEIYNCDCLRKTLGLRGHKFNSTSDTEVLLAAYRTWGTACLEHLSGMFAFVIYDAQHDQLFMARDRCGEKPFYFYHSETEFYFASELKGLMAFDGVERIIDANAFSQYLTFGFVAGERAMVKNCRKLKAAHAAILNIKTQKLSEWCYWQIPDSRPEAEANLLTLSERLEHLLAASVDQQLVADVPVGVLLSGGIDSSLVTALASQSSARFNTYTVTFADRRNSEADNARLVAAHFGTTHEELVIDLDSFERIEAIIEKLDEPVGDSSIVPTYLVAELVRQKCTVALGGDGGDELFGGYNHYARMKKLSQLMVLMPKMGQRLISKLAIWGMPTGLPGRNYIAAFDIPPSQTPFANIFFDRNAQWELSKNRTRESIAEVPPALDDRGGHDFVDAATRLDFRNYLPDNILAKVDRASMLHSLEMRAPFLSPEVVTFAFSQVPSAAKLHRGQGKQILRHLVRKLLPTGFDMSRKQGFEAPVGSWMRQATFRKIVEEVLLDDGCLFAPTAIRRLLDSIEQGKNNGERIFALLVFEKWRRQNRVAL